MDEEEMQHDDDAEVQCLTNGNHKSMMFDALFEQQKNNEFVDVTFHCFGGKSISAHKNVLAACSRYLSDAFHESRDEKHYNAFFRDIQFKDMVALIKYCYLGKVQIPLNQTKSFLKMCAYLLVEARFDRPASSGLLMEPMLDTADIVMSDDDSSEDTTAGLGDVELMDSDEGITKEPEITMEGRQPEPNVPLVPETLATEPEPKIDHYPAAADEQDVPNIGVTETLLNLDGNHIVIKTEIVDADDEDGEERIWSTSKAPVPTEVTLTKYNEAKEVTHEGTYSLSTKPEPSHPVSASTQGGPQVKAWRHRLTSKLLSSKNIKSPRVINDDKGKKAVRPTRIQPARVLEASNLYHPPIKVIKSESPEAKYTPRHKSRSIRCKLCPSTFRSRPKLHKHLDCMHRDMTVSPIESCPVCSVVLSSKECVQLHILKFHHLNKSIAGIEVPECLKCGESFSDMRTLKIHLFKEHYNSNICTVCQKFFGSKKQTKDHLIQAHILSEL